MTPLVLKVRPVGSLYGDVGDGRYTAHDIGEVLSRVLGRPVPVQEISADSYLTALFGNVDRSQLQHQARVVRSISSRYSSHDFVGNSNVLRWLLDRPPTSFEQFVRAEHALGLEPELSVVREQRGPVGHPQRFL